MLAAVSLALLGLHGPTGAPSGVERKLEESVLVLTDRVPLRRLVDKQVAVLAYDWERETFRVIVSRNLRELNAELPGKSKRWNYGLRGEAREKGIWSCEVTRDEFRSMLESAHALHELTPDRDLGYVEELYLLHVGVRVLHRDVDWQNPWPSLPRCLITSPKRPEESARFAEITNGLWAFVDALPLRRLGDDAAPPYVMLPTRKLPAFRIATRRARREPFAAELDLNRTTVTAQDRSELSVSIPFREQPDRYFRVRVDLGVRPVGVVSELLKP